MSYQAAKRHGGILNALLLSERSHSEKATYCMIPTMQISGKGKTTETAKRTVVAKSLKGKKG